MLDENDQQEFAEYRITPKHFYMGVIMSCFYLIAGVPLLLAILVQLNWTFREVLPVAVFFGLFWSPMVAVGVYGIAAYFHERLILRSDSVIQQSVFSKKTYHLNEVTRIEWRLLPRTGWIKVFVGDSRLSVHPSIFSKQDREEIIDYFRSAVNEELQTGWEESLERIAKFKSRPTEITWQLSARFAVLFIAGSVASIYLWTFDIGNYLLGIAAVCIALGIASLVGSILHYKKAKNTPEELVEA